MASTLKLVVRVVVSSMQLGEGGRWTSSSREEGGARVNYVEAVCTMYMQALCVYNHIVHINVQYVRAMCVRNWY